MRSKSLKSFLLTTTPKSNLKRLKSLLNSLKSNAPSPCQSKNTLNAGITLLHVTVV
uniref:Uncharacterized protein n=1 Tax=Podoviridae sp. ctZkC8 TaxID=2825259 RepID=A0A8S5UC32_9CAUD|nr:MAG TPA: hypothetical protein [Podoviridae sp. ctZkC8]